MAQEVLRSSAIVTSGPGPRRCAPVLQLLAAYLVVGGLVASPGLVRAQGEPEPAVTTSGEMDLDEISRALDNPLGNLWIIFTENQMYRYRGDPAPTSKWINTLLLQPILPISLTRNWNLVTRPIMPFITAPKLNVRPEVFGDCPDNCNSDPPGVPGFDVNGSRHNGWGDLNIWTMLSPAEPRELADGSKFVWGLGPTAQLPTATEDQFGSERYTVGPSSIFMRLPAKDGRWTLGLFNQHLLWSMGGNSDRARVKSSQIQYIWWYQLQTERPISIGAAPMINVNWQADDNNKLSLPIGIGASTTTFFGKMPVRLGIEFDYFVVSPSDYGPKFMFKFYFVPVLPRLITKPIFGD